MTSTYLNMFPVDKTTLILKCATCKVFFMYWSLISAEYEHQMIMEMRFPSDSKFPVGGHFCEIFVEISKFYKIQKLIIFENQSLSWYSSTSPTGGNQVDGLPPVWNITRRAGVFPMESNTKTIANRAKHCQLDHFGVVVDHFLRAQVCRA